MLYNFKSKGGTVSTVRMRCHHSRPRADPPDRILIQEQGGTRYLIAACSTCAEIALRSAGEFTEIAAWKKAAWDGAARVRPGWEGACHA